MPAYTDCSSVLDCHRGTMSPVTVCVNAADAVPSTPHLCLTNLWPTPCNHASTILPPTQVLYVYT